MDDRRLKILETLRKYNRNRKMTVNLIKKLLRLKTRPSNKLAYKFIALKWFTSKRCRFVYDNSETYSALPENWSNTVHFKMIYIDRTFTVTIITDDDGISVDLTYRTRSTKKSIRRGLYEFNDTIPDVQNEALSTKVRSDEKDHLVWQYSQIIYQFECEFGRVILHCFTNNEEPRSTPGTPAINYGVQKKRKLQKD